MSNLYGGMLKIDDGFSITINRFKNSMNGAGGALKKFTSESSRSSNAIRDKWSRSFNDIGRSSEKMTSKMLSSIKRITVAWLSVQSTVKATKSIIEAGINVQNSRMYIDAIFGKSGNAVQKFKQAQDFAARTPFNSVDITNAMAKAQMLGLGTSQADMKKYADLGSIAKLNGSGGIAEAVDAYADMMNGEFERMQTILGIKKRNLEQYSKENNMGRFTNKQGQITDKDKLKDVFDSYIQSRGITGITEKYSQTLEGRLSTLTDNFKTSLAKIGGIQDDGSVKAGSLFDNFSKGVERLITSLERFGKSEAFNVLQENLGKIGSAVIDFIDKLTENPEKLQKIFDTINNFVDRLFNVVKFNVKHPGIVQTLLGGAIFSKLGELLFKYLSELFNSISESIYDHFGVKPKDAIKGIIDGIRTGDMDKAYYDATYGKYEKENRLRKKAELDKNKKNGVVFNKSVFNKAVFNSAKFIGTKNSPFSNDSKKKNKSNKSKLSIRPDERASELIPYVNNEIKPHTKPDVKSGVNSGIKGSGLLSIAKKALSKLGTITVIIASAATIVNSFLKQNGFIHKGINTLGGFITGDKSKDYSSRLYGNGIVKGEAWIANKLGILDDDQLKYAYKAVDNYIQNSDDYINGKTTQNPDIRHMGNYNPTNTVNVNIDKIEKDVDSDKLIDKLSEIMDTWNDRNAIGTNY